MKKELKVLNGGAGKSPSNGAYYKNIINEHFEFIEKQCFNAVRLKIGDVSAAENTLNIENEALELSNRVLDTLQRNDYRVLKEFKGNSRLTTYLTAIISRHAVDLIRKKLGRDREKERAKEWGDVGLLVYRRVIKNGYPLGDVFNELQTNGAFSGSIEELETMVHKIKGKNPHTSHYSSNGNSVVKNGKTVNENEYVIPDTKNDPQETLMEKQRHEKIRQALQSIIAPLSGEERLLLRMRFPAHEEEKPRSVEQISQALGITQKAVYKRITRLMKKCRDKLQQEGVTVHDLL